MSGVQETVTTIGRASAVPIQASQSNRRDKILWIALSRNGEFVASLNQERLVRVHEWQIGEKEGMLKNDAAYYEATIQKTDEITKLFESKRITKSIAVANSGDVCAVSFVDKDNPFPNENSDPSPLRVSPIIIQFHSKKNDTSFSSAETPTTPGLIEIEEGVLDPPCTIEILDQHGGTVFFDNDSQSDIMFVCCPPYVHVYRWTPGLSFKLVRTIHFDMHSIVRPLDLDLNVGILHNKVDRFTFMCQSIPQLNEESYHLRMSMLHNIGRMDRRWKCRFALSSDGTRLAVISNVDKNVVDSRYIIIHILLTATGLEIIRWRAKIKPKAVRLHEEKLFIVAQKHIHIYDINTGLSIKEPVNFPNRVYLHPQKNFSLQQANEAIEIQTVIRRPSQREELKLKTMGECDSEFQTFGDWQLKIEHTGDDAFAQWICLVKRTQESKPKKFSFQPVSQPIKKNSASSDLKEYTPFKETSKFTFSVIETGTVLIVTSVTVQLWSLPNGADKDTNYTLLDFWCINKLGILRDNKPNVIDENWTKAERVGNTGQVRVFLRIKKDGDQSGIKDHHEIVMGEGSELRMAFNCCYYLLLLSKILNENSCYWTVKPPNLETVPDLTVEINKTLRRYIPTYRFPRIDIRLIDSPILYLFNFVDLDTVFALYRDYCRLIFTWMYECDDGPVALFYFVSDTVVRAKIVRWLIRQIQHGEIAYGFLLQQQLPNLMRHSPELAGEVARGLSYHISVAPNVRPPDFFRHEDWPELRNLDVEIFTRHEHLKPIAHFTDHIDHPGSHKIKQRSLASRLLEYPKSIARSPPVNYLRRRLRLSLRLRSASVCVVPLLNFCRYKSSGKSTFTEIADIMIERNFVQIAEPFLEAIVNHKWRAFARSRFYIMFISYLAYFGTFIILLECGSNMWLSAIIIIFAGVFILIGVMKFFNRHKAYLCGTYFFIGSNLLELGAFIFPIACTSLLLTNRPVPTYLRTSSVLLLWFRLLMQLRIYKSVGMFLAVISEIVWEMFPFLIVLMVAYMAFAHAFYEFLKGTSPHTDATSIINGGMGDSNGSLEISPFDPSGQNFTQTFATVMTNVYFFTTQNYASIAMFMPEAALLTILFSITTTLLLFNVLIALLNNVYGKALESGRRLWLLRFVQIVADNELLFVSNKLQRRTDLFPPYVYYIAHSTMIASYKNMIARDYPEDNEDKHKQIFKWGPEQQFSDVYENIPDVVEALSDYNPPKKKRDHLRLKHGQLVDVVMVYPCGWWYGECEDRKGFFPCNFVGRYTEEPRCKNVDELGRSHTYCSEDTLVSEAGSKITHSVQNDLRRLPYPCEGPLPIPGPPRTNIV